MEEYNLLSDMDDLISSIIKQVVPNMKEGDSIILLGELKDKQKDWKEAIQNCKKLTKNQKSKLLENFESHAKFLNYHKKHEDKEDKTLGQGPNENETPSNSIEKFIIENCQTPLDKQKRDALASIMGEHLENIYEVKFFDNQNLVSFIDKAYKSTDLLRYYTEKFKIEFEQVILKEEIENINDLHSQLINNALRGNIKFIEENEDLTGDNIENLISYLNSSPLLFTLKKFNVQDDEGELVAELSSLITTLDENSKSTLLKELIKVKSLANLNNPKINKELELLIYSNENFKKYFLKHFEKTINSIITEILKKNQDVEEDQIPAFSERLFLEIKKEKNLTPIENDPDIVEDTIQELVSSITSTKLIIDFIAIQSLENKEESSKAQMSLEISNIINDVCPKLKNKEEFINEFIKKDFDFKLIDALTSITKNQKMKLSDALSKIIKKPSSSIEKSGANEEIKGQAIKEAVSIKKQEIAAKSENDELELLNLKRIREKFIGHNPDYDFEIFTKIYNRTGKDIINILNQKLNNEENESLLDVIMPLLVSQLKVGTDISNIFLDEIFCRKKSSNLFGIDLKTAIACMLDRYNFHHFKLINLLKKQTISIPIIYKSYNPNSKKIIYNFPLSALSNILSNDAPCVVNLGERRIGKTTLLNKIYFTKFYTNKGIVNGGVDVCFNCDEYASGFNIFDISEDIFTDKIVELTLNCVTKNSIWVILHVRNREDCFKIREKLREIGIRDSQVIIIFRDCSDLSALKEEDKKLETYLDSLEKNGTLVLDIEKTPNEPVPSFESSLCYLRSQIFRKTGIGSKAKAPFQLLPKTKNIYWPNEANIKQIDSSMTQTLFYDYEFKNFSLEIEEKLNALPTNIDSYQDFIFVFLCQAKKIGALTKSKNELKNEEKDLQRKLADIDNQISNIEHKRKTSQPNDLVIIFNKIFIDKKFNYIQEFDRAIATWLTPIIKPILVNRQILVDSLTELKSSLNNESKISQNSNPKISLLKKEIDDVEIKIGEIANIIDMKLINVDLFSRELLSIYSHFKEGKLSGFNRVKYLESLCDYLVKGNEIEIIDGDNNQLNIDVIEEIFLLVQNKLNWQNTSPFVVAVIGPQSTGKSTLLNMLFGSNFQMSAGRCTKGLYASIFKTEFKEMESLLVLDTEGLLSIERNSEEYDRKLTLFSMACSNIMLINLNGEINSSMKKILTISLFAAKQLNMFKVKPVIIFVLRNMMDLDKTKQTEMISGVNKALAEVVSQASDSNTEKMSLCEILDFRNDESFFLMLSAFNKDSVSNQEYGEPVELFQNYKTNNKFSNLISDLRIKIVKIAKQVYEENSNYKNLASWIKNAGNIWESINYYNDLFLFDSIKEIRERSYLSDKLNEIIKNYISNSSECEATLNNELDTIISNYENSNEISDEKVSLELSDVKLRYEENVLYHFEDLVKNSNCCPNLLKEYKNNLKSIIESNYNNSRRKLESVKDKKGIKSILSNSIKSLTIKCQKNIIEWQKISKDNSNIEDKEILKRKILENLLEELNKEEEKILSKLTEQKKSEEQIKANIYAMFQLSYNSLPVEKRFFSLNTIYDKRRGLKNKNFIDILSTINNREYFHSLLNIIPTYFKFDDVIREKNKREAMLKKSILKEGEKFNTEIEVKVDKKDKGFFTKVADGIVNFFSSSKSSDKKSVKNSDKNIKEENKKSIQIGNNQNNNNEYNNMNVDNTFVTPTPFERDRTNSVANRVKMFSKNSDNTGNIKNENTKSNQIGNNQNNKKNNEYNNMMVDDTYVSSFPSERDRKNSVDLVELLGQQIITFIKFIFDETIYFLNDNIRAGIVDKKQYNFNNLKDHLYSIYEKLSELDAKLKPNYLYLKTGFKDDIVSWMFDLILERVLQLEEIQLAECMSQFTEAKEKALKNFRDRLEKDFGDAENSKEIAILMMNNLKKYCIKKFLIEYTSSLRKTTNKLPKDMLDECYNIFKTTLTEEIYHCVTNFNSYMHKIFEKGFKEQNGKLQKKIKEEIMMFLMSENGKITEMLNSLVKMFRTNSINTPTESNSEDESKDLLSFIKAYFDNKEKALELCRKINENGRFNLIWDDDILECNSAPFIFGKDTEEEMSPSIYSIENPEFFLTCLIYNFSNLTIMENDLIAIFDSSDILGQVDEILNSHFSVAKGCNETCPYCGSKCTAIHGEIIDEQTRHSTDKHLLMAFKGCYEYSEHGKQFVFDLCNSNYNLTQSKWIDSKDPNSVKNSQNDNLEIRQRMTNYGIQGVNSEVRFTVLWNNWNDLDLRVKCPCGTEILGIGDWGLGIGDWAQSPIPNPQSPIPITIFILNSQILVYIDISKNYL
jgi:hypothetical protein